MSTISSYPIENLIPSSENPRTISKKNEQRLGERLQRWGHLGTIVARKVSKSEARIISGHQRWEQLRQAGAKKVDVHLVDCDEHEERELRLALNGHAGEWDAEALERELQALASNGSDLAALQVEHSALDAVIARLEDERETSSPSNADHIDDLPSAPPHIHSERGQVYELGEHRLMCGDCTSKEDWAQLQPGKIDLLLTDPPYCSGGSQSSGKTTGSIGSRQIQKGGKFAGGIANDKLSNRGYQALMKRTLELIPAPAAYIFTDWRMWSNLSDLVESSGFVARNMIVWNKESPGMGNGWRTQHELALFAVKETVELNGHKAVGNVITCKRTGNKLHPTQKPVELIEKILGVHEDGQRVADPFAGSGTTLIACAQQGRVFYGMELSPGFCDVIRRRWTLYAEENDIEAGSGALA